MGCTVQGHNPKIFWPAQDSTGMSTLPRTQASCSGSCIVALEKHQRENLDGFHTWYGSTVTLNLPDAHEGKCHTECLCYCVSRRGSEGRRYKTTAKVTELPGVWVRCWPSVATAADWDVSSHSFAEILKLSEIVRQYWDEHSTLLSLVRVSGDPEILWPSQDSSGMNICTLHSLFPFLSEFPVILRCSNSSTKFNMHIPPYN